MLIPLIVIGVLFLITWVVIGVSATPTPAERGHDSHDHCPTYMVDPYHSCAYSKLQGRMDSELSFIRAEQRQLAQRVDYADPEYKARQKAETERLMELLKETPPKNEPPKEITIKNAKYKLAKAKD